MKIEYRRPNSEMSTWILEYFNVYMWSTFLFFFFSETQGFSHTYDGSSSDSDSDYSDYTSSEDEDGLLQINVFIK